MTDKQPKWTDMGWGPEEDADRPRRSLYAEQILHEKNVQLFGESMFSEPAEEQRLTDHIVEMLKDLWKFDEGFDFGAVERMVYGKEAQRGPQSHGNCVGASHCYLIQARLAFEVLAGQADELLGDYDDGETPVPYIPYSYGAGRCLVSGRMCGPRDGSYCSSQLRATQEHGFLPPPDISPHPQLDAQEHL